MTYNKRTGRLIGIIRYLMRSVAVHILYPNSVVEGHAEKSLHDGLYLICDPAPVIWYILRKCPIDDR